MRRKGLGRLPNPCESTMASFSVELGRDGAREATLGILDYLLLLVKPVHTLEQEVVQMLRSRLANSVYH